MNHENYLQRLLDETELVTTKEECKDNVILLGSSLLTSFGLNMESPRHEPNVSRGYENAKRFLKGVCSVFEEPTHIVRIAPFAYAYLGAEMFNQTLDIVLERARKHPDEQHILDEVFTGTALVRPEYRQKFLSSVRSADTIFDGILGLESIIRESDTKAKFTTPDEFPGEFKTSDVRLAIEMLGVFIEQGMFKPGEGFNQNYYRKLERMKSLDYLFKKPSLEHALIITNNNLKRTLKKYLFSK